MHGSTWLMWLASETFNLSCDNDNKRIIHILAPHPGSGTRVGRKTLLLKPFHVKVGNHYIYWRPSARTFSLSVVISLVQKIDGREARTRARVWFSSLSSFSRRFLICWTALSTGTLVNRAPTSYETILSEGKILNEDTTSKVLPLEPQHCHTNRGRPRTTYIDTFKGETGLDNTKEIRDATLDQSACQNIFSGWLGMISGPLCSCSLGLRIVKASWNGISKYVHNSAANISHFPAVDQRIQGWIEKRQC